MTEKLKPCPFCGGKAEFDETREQEHFVFCKDCGGMTVPFDTQQEAAEAWNFRPFEDEKDAEIARLRGALEHATTTETTVDKWGIWRIDGKTFQTWAADVLKGKEE